MNRRLKRMVSQNSSLMNDSNDFIASPPHQINDYHNQDQFALSTKQMMEIDIENLPPFEINNKQSWKIISQEILGGFPALNQYESSQFKKKAFSETPKQPFQRSKLLLHRKRIANRIAKKDRQYSVDWNISLLSKNKQTQIISLTFLPSRVRKSNRSQTMLNNNLGLAEQDMKFTLSFRRKSCEGDFFGLETNKEKKHINLQCEVDMHKKQRMADIIIKNLKGGNNSRKTIININVENRKVNVLKKIIEEQNLQSIQYKNFDLPLIEQPVAMSSQNLDSNFPMPLKIRSSKGRLSRIQSQKNLRENDSMISQEDSEKQKNQDVVSKMSSKNQLKSLMKTSQNQSQSIHLILLKRSKQGTIAEQIFARSHFNSKEKLNLQLENKQSQNIRSLHSITTTSKAGRDQEILSVYTQPTKKYKRLHFKSFQTSKLQI